MTTTWLWPLPRPVADTPLKRYTGKRAAALYQRALAQGRTKPKPSRAAIQRGNDFLAPRAPFKED